MWRVLTLGIVPVLLVGCSFSEYAQSADVVENIDDYRTGCEVDVDKLMAEYQQYDANQLYIDFGFGTPRPTPTPSPVSDTDVATAVLLEKVWKNGCQTGRRDAVGTRAATLMQLQDQVALILERIEALEEPAP